MRVFLTCLLLLSATQSQALSCLRPDAVRLFEMARDADASFYMVKGSITLLEPANVPPRGSKTSTFTRARVDGLALSSGDFQVPFRRDIMVETSCAGPWCGDPQNLSGDMIMAIEVDGDALTLNVGPCGGDQVTWDETGEDRLLACYVTGTCNPAEF